MAMNGNSNPWKGLEPYQEGDQCLFCGRADEVRTLTDLIEKNTIITLYGRSGVGKTSLIKAGVFPRLKQLGNYCPTVVRLSADRERHGDTVESMEDCIVRSIMAVCGISGHAGQTLSRFVEDKSFFKDKKPVIPVIVLDQFEEILRNSHDTQPLNVVLSLRSILDNSPSKIRFVISIREDDLFRLEDLLDSNHVDQLKQNRYRLRDISQEGARQVVNAVAYHSGVKIEDGLFEKLYDRLLKDDQATEDIDSAEGKKELTETNEQHSEVSTLLLSLYCNRMYRGMSIRKGDTIDTSDLEALGAKPLLQYYREAIKGLSKSQIKFIDTMAEGGYRASKPWSELEKRLRNNTEYLCTTGNPRQLFVVSSHASNEDDSNGDTMFELLHDRLAKNIYEDRLQRDIENRQRRGRWVLMAIGASALLLLVFGIILWSTNRYPTFKSTKAYNGKLQPHAKPYAVPSGHLILDNGIKVYVDALKREDIKKLTLDSAIILETKPNYDFPNLDTVEILPGYGYDEELYLTHAKVFKVHRPRHLLHVMNEKPRRSDMLAGMAKVDDKMMYLYYNTYVIHAPELRKDKCELKDTNNLIWSCGTIFIKDADFNVWIPIITTWPDGTLYACASDFPRDMSDSVPIIIVNDSNLIYNYDIASPTPIDQDKKYRVICSDPTLKSVGRDKIAGINKNNILFVDLETVDTIRHATFQNCHNLREVSLSQAKQIGTYSFEGCMRLERLNMNNVIDVGDCCFFKDTLLQNVSMPSVVYIGTCAFDSCIHLDSVFMPHLFDVGICAFRQSALRNVDQPKVEWIGEYAYSNCNKIERVNFEKLSGSVYAKCFAWCSNLTTVNMPNLKKIPAGMFTGCSMLQEISIPNVTLIEDTAFKNNRRLRKLYVPKVEKIGSNAFKGCLLLEEISWGNNDPQYDSTSFDGCNALSRFFYSNGELATCDSIGVHRRPSTEKKKSGKSSSNIVHKKGYDIVGNTIVISADTIEKLVIPRYVTNIVGLNSDKVIKKVRMERGKRYTWQRKGICCSLKDGLVVYTSTERVFATVFADDGAIIPEKPLPKTAKEVIIFSPWFDSILPEGSTLLVPHGQKWRYADKWDKVVELSAIETALYMPMTIFNSPIFYLTDILVWFFSLAIALLFWVVIAPAEIRERKKSFYLLLILVVAYCLIAFLAWNGLPVLRRLNWPRPFSWLRLSGIVIAIWALFLLGCRYYPIIKRGGR